MAASRKKVIVRRLGQGWVSGYLPPASFLDHDGVGVLDLDGKVTLVPLSDIKWICFVREFTGDPHQPERLLRKTFARRPRSQGLWIRARLKDMDLVEGLAQNDLSLVGGDGLFLIPPDSRSNTQRMFLPRQAIVEFEIVAVIRGGPAHKPQDSLQETLFK